MWVQSATSSLKINTLVPTAISKRAKFYFTFVFAVFSLNFGFVTFKSFRLHCVVTVCCFVQVSFVSFSVFSYYVTSLQDSILICWYLKYVCEYCVITAAIYITKKKSFYVFWSDLINIDLILENVNGIKTVELIIISLSIYSVCYRIMSSVFYCTFFKEYCISSKVVIVTYQIPLLGIDTFLIMYFIIFFSIYLRLKKFIDYVSNASRDIISCHCTYKKIIDITESGKTVFDIVYLIPLVCHSFDLLLTVFFPLLMNRNEKKTSDIFTMIIANVSIVHVMLLLFAPAFAAGLLSGQAEKLKLILHERLIQERDNKYTKDIERFIKYIEARPCKFRILRIVPLDWTLPIIVLNICITYLIVAIQFTVKT